MISNAGFELLAECLHMRIPILVKPVKGQMEQHSNACALQQLGWGDTLETLDEMIGHLRATRHRNLDPQRNALRDEILAVAAEINATSPLSSAASASS